MQRCEDDLLAGIRSCSVDLGFRPCRAGHRAAPLAAGWWALRPWSLLSQPGEAGHRGALRKPVLSTYRGEGAVAAKLTDKVLGSGLSNRREETDTVS